MKNYIIRKPTSADREEYLRLTSLFYQTDGVMAPVPKEYLEKCFDELLTRDTYAVCYLIESDKKTAGYVLLAKTFSQEGGGDTVWIEELFILPEFRGKGYATALLKYCIENHPAMRYRLEVEPDNLNAVAIYNKEGFRFIPYREMTFVPKDK